MCCIGDSIRLEPPAIAISQPSWRMLMTARCTATSELEQAVSITWLGP